MALEQYRIFLLVSAALLLLNGVSGATEEDIPGGYYPIKNISDPHVQELGEFAVTVYNFRANTSLKFSRVISGENQLVNGINYRLVIEVKPPKKYQAVVYEKRDLSSFKPLLRG